MERGGFGPLLLPALLPPEERREKDATERKQEMIQKVRLPAPALRAWQIVGTAVVAAFFFFAVCLNAASTVKAEAVLLIVLTLSAVFLFYTKLRDRIKPPVLALGLLVLWDGASVFYAASGKLALYEFLKVLTAFCMALLFLAFSGKANPGRQAASVLEGCTAIAGLVSIDLLSTRFISTAVLSFLGQFTPDFESLSAVEAGIRMTTVFMNPNVFAGCAGLGVLLSLGLASSAEKPAERAAHLVCLSVSALSFVLVFSMGGCAAIVPAFLALLLLERKERRAGLLLLMVETLVVTMLAAFPASVTGLTVWDGVQPVPLLCTIGGAGLLCALDLLLGKRILKLLSGHGRAVLILVAAAVVGVAAFFIAAFHLTDGASLQAGEFLRRAAYPEPGFYTMTAEADGPVTVTVESQNRADAMMHTSSVLYSGELAAASFTVPEDSLVVYFNFTAGADLRLERAEITDGSASTSIPLHYKLLPGFIANRMQGLFANQNAIQRLVFFEDGMKLFAHSPVIGLGLGAFSNAVRSVQTFYYETKYVHNHYIQALVDTGIVGLLLFLGLLAVSAAAVWRGRRAGRPLAPALGAALVFMACHGSVEVIFSHFSYLPIAFGVFAVINLCCGGDLPVPAWSEGKAVRNGILLGISALLVIFGVLLNNNIRAQNLAYQAEELSDLEKAARLDPFEWADHMLSYVMRSAASGQDEAVRQTAAEYADRLGRLNSNTIPIHLAEYYFYLGDVEQGFAMVEKYVDYLAADETAWQRAFDLLARYETGDAAFRAGAARIAGLLESWNEENMGTIALTPQAEEFIARVRS